MGSSFTNPDTCITAVAWPVKRGERELLPLIPSMHKQLHQRANSSRIEERDAAHVHYKAWRTLRPHGLQKFGDCFQYKLAIEPSHRRRTVMATFYVNI
jgi:hypothetical protein